MACVLVVFYTILLTAVLVLSADTVLLTAGLVLNVDTVPAAYVHKIFYQRMGLTKFIQTSKVIYSEPSL